jgi:hypothetical protein
MTQNDKLAKIFKYYGATEQIMMLVNFQSKMMKATLQYFYVSNTKKSIVKSNMVDAIAINMLLLKQFMANLGIKEQKISDLIDKYIEFKTSIVEKRSTKLMNEMLEKIKKENTNDNDND